MHIRRGDSRFTLIELLVIVSIIAVLAAMLLPALSKARAKAKRLSCLVNQNQSWKACQMYADENSDQLPVGYNSSWPVGIFNHPGKWTIRTYLDDYIGDYSIWVCSTLGNAPMDDPRNTRTTAQYTPWYYFPGFPTPEFAGKPAPVNTREVANTSDRVMLQDQVTDLTRQAVGKWRYNHGKGDLVVVNQNPSGMQYHGVSRFLCEGANLTYYDGHSEWTAMTDLEYVGSLATVETNAWVYSRLP